MTNPQKPWLQSYLPGVPSDIQIPAYQSVAEMLEASFARFPDRNACECMGQFFSYRQMDIFSKNFAAYLQSLGLPPDARVAIMLPNVVQFPIAMMGILRAGFIVVNINPLYTPRELEHQLSDSGASVLIVLENFAHVYQQVAARVQVQHVVVTRIGEMLGFKGKLIDLAIRHIKKGVPKWSFAHSSFKQVLRQGAQCKLKQAQRTPDDIAFLQYTGGTTGISKGAILLHRNIIANVIQTELWLEPGLNRHKGDQLVFLCALPLYHIFALTCALFGFRKGGLVILVPNPRDIKGFIQLLATHPNINLFPGVNTLFNALVHHPNFLKVKLPHLIVTIGGGMSVQKIVADQWQKLTGSVIVEAYGLSETSPAACINNVLIDHFTETIGLPIPSTEVAIMGDAGKEVPFGTPGEICIRGPQVMAGYWNQPEATILAMTPEGFFKSGDIGVMNEEGYIKIIDRKKDMIIVSGFNVFPNELEAVLAAIPGVLECAVIGVGSDQTGESVKAFIVKSDPELTENQVLEYCKKELTNYKRPKQIQFIDELPKTNVGKVLRRSLRDL